MKIAFINPNGHTSQSPRAPLGLLSIATVCKEAGHDVSIIDANGLNLLPTQIIERVKDCTVIGLTAMTPTIAEAMKIADIFFDKFIILGGVHASVFPEECADTGMFDAVVMGEGEDVILKTLEDIAESAKPRIKCEVYIGGSVNLDSIPLPDYSLLDLSLYHARPPHALRQPWTTASTSRGCPYSCSFCYKAVSGHGYHAMQPLQMMELVEKLQSDHNIKDITFYDDLFTMDRVRVKLFCEKLIANRVDLTWTCESRVNLTDAYTLERMSEAGCRLIYYGVESGNQKILDGLCKKQTLDQVRTAIGLTKNAGIQSAGYFMLGCPGETKQTMKETVAFARDIGLDHAQFSVCMPMPGSELYDIYVKSGYPLPGWSNFWYLGKGNSPMFTSRDLSREDIEDAVRDANEYWVRNTDDNSRNTLP